MPDSVLVWDLETIPDLPAVARVHDLDETDLDGAREKLGGKFPKLMFHSICAIAALVAEKVDGAYIVRSLGAPHTGERSEAALIQSFVDKIAERRPKLVGFNTSGFDLPVLRYRAMTQKVSAPGLEARRYLYRYSDDALDLCDLLSAYGSRDKCSLNDLCRLFGYPGKPADIDGSQVAEYVGAGRIAEVAAYAETDAVSTLRLYLRHELFRGALTPASFEASEDNLLGYISDKLSTKPHLGFLLGRGSSITVDPVIAGETAQVEAAV